MPPPASDTRPNNAPFGPLPVFGSVPVFVALPVVGVSAAVTGTVEPSGPTGVVVTVDPV